MCLPYQAKEYVMPVNIEMAVCILSLPLTIDSGSFRAQKNKFVTYAMRKSVSSPVHCKRVLMMTRHRRHI